MDDQTKGVVPLPWTRWALKAALGVSLLAVAFNVLWAANKPGGISNSDSRDVLSAIGTCWLAVVICLAGLNRGR